MRQKHQAMKNIFRQSFERFRIVRKNIMESWINNNSIVSSHDLLHFGKVIAIFKTIEAETKNRLLASQIKKMA